MPIQIRRREFVCSLIVVLLVAVLSGCGSAGDDEAENEMEVVTVERGSLVTSVTATGNVLPKAEVMLSFETGGQVSEVLIEAGERVEAGQPLVRLDIEDLERRVTQAEISLRQAQLRLEQIQEPADEAAIRTAQHAVDQSWAALEIAQINLTTVLSSTLLNEALEDAQSEFENASNHLERRLREYEDGEIDYYLVDQAEDDYEDAQLVLARVQQQADLQLESAQSDVTRAQQTYQEARDNLEQLLDGADAQELEAVELDVEAAQLALDTARDDLEAAMLVAPFDGVVGRVEVEPGEFVAPQAPAVALVDDGQFTIEVDVDEADIGWVEPGQEVQITVDAFPGRVITGTVTAIAPSATFDGGVVSYGVTIEIAPNDLPLRGGLTANAEIIRERRDEVLLIPNRAIWIDSDTNQTFVEKWVDGEIVIAVIEQGATTEQSSEVLSGLQQGDQVVIRSVSVRDRFRDVVTMPMTGQ